MSAGVVRSTVEQLADQVRELGSPFGLRVFDFSTPYSLARRPFKTIWEVFSELKAETRTGAAEAIEMLKRAEVAPQ